MPDTRYLDSQEKFLGYAWSVFSEYYDRQEVFAEQFEWIREAESKNLFLKLASFYKFLVKEGTFRIKRDGQEEVVDYLDETYKFIAIMSFIAALYSHDRHVDFYQWLSMRERRGEVFPIDNMQKLDGLYRDYKAEYGANKKAEKFFVSLPGKIQDLLASSIKIDGEYKPAGALASLLYAIRSEFVHAAELVLELGSGTMISVRGEDVVVSELSLRDLMKVFEHGLLHHFGFVPYKKAA